MNVLRIPSPRLSLILGLTLLLLPLAGCDDDGTTSGNTDVIDEGPTTCEVDCDCPQGEACASGRCVALVEPVFCCDKAGCQQGQACVNGEGRVSTCPECVVDCDCAQGQACVGGACVRGSVDVFCCDNPGCPPGQACTDVSGAASTCEKECEVDCDCPQGQICSASGLCLATAEPTYCCDNPGCPFGEACTERGGAAATCKECDQDCDCPQGQICSASGLCLETLEPTYCCDNAGCPEGELCTDLQGGSGICAGDDATCGNGEIEPGETCDGNCPRSCGSLDPCRVSELIGDPDACTAECVTRSINICQGGDSCCPSGCDDSTDSDCPSSESCGNGQLDPGETCDGDCPTSCNDFESCTFDSLSGSAAACTASCSYEPISACFTGDACCPEGCTYATDRDCACTPRSCAAQGLECGAASNGCGEPLNCGDCSGSDSCVSGACVAAGDGSIGDPCASAADCTGDICATPDLGWKDGYCSQTCQFDNDCPSGSHCGNKNADGQGFCLKNCVSDDDCRPEGYRCYDAEANDGDTSKECFAAATGDQPIGGACEGTWECSSGGTCITDPDWPGGYCSQSCILIIGGCPEGAICQSLGTGGNFEDFFCLDACTTGSDCRSGYSCQAFSDPFGGAANACAP